MLSLLEKRNSIKHKLIYYLDYNTYNSWKSQLWLEDRTSERYKSTNWPSSQDLLFLLLTLDFETDMYKNVNLFWIFIGCGKISDFGLWSNWSEVKVYHKSRKTWTEGKNKLITQSLGALISRRRKWCQNNIFTKYKNVRTFKNCCYVVAVETQMKN